MVLILDHLGPRGRRFNCPLDNPVSVTDYATDAIEALRFLRAQGYVDGKRVAQAGFSYGAMAGLRLASTGFARRNFGEDKGFSAVIAFYPWCNERVGPAHQDHQWNFYDDIGTPLLVLLGENDDEADPRSCIDQARKNAERGQPVAWKVYEKTTHAFDFANAAGEYVMFKRATPRGTVTYRGDAQAVERAWQDMKAFLDRHLAAK